MSEPKPTPKTTREDCEELHRVIREGPHPDIEVRANFTRVTRRDRESYEVRMPGDVGTRSAVGGPERRTVTIEQAMVEVKIGEQQLILDRESFLAVVNAVGKVLPRRLGDDRVGYVPHQLMGDHLD